MLNQRTANRRRWSHVFPMGQAEFRVTNTLTEAKPGPNWTSLVSPAVLPLTTDYLPRLERKAEYEENPYSVMLSDVDSLHGGAAAAATAGGGGGGGGGVTGGYTSHHALIQEMVAQRIAGDFQLYQKPGEVMSGRKGAGMSIGATLGSAHRVYYAMSMGHRIHEITYDERASKRIDVKVRNAPPPSLFSPTRSTFAL